MLHIISLLYPHAKSSALLHTGEAEIQLSRRLASSSVRHCLPELYHDSCQQWITDSMNYISTFSFLYMTSGKGPQTQVMGGRALADLAGNHESSVGQ